MKKLLWLDDIRNPFSADWLMMYAPDYAYGDGEVIWVKNYKDFCDWITENGLPDKIAFDHDLGEEKSGYDAAHFVVNYCLDNDIHQLPVWVIQSANPVGAENINGLFKSFLRQS